MSLLDVLNSENKEKQITFRSLCFCVCVYDAPVQCNEPNIYSVGLENDFELLECETMGFSTKSNAYFDFESVTAGFSTELIL